MFFLLLSCVSTLSSAFVLQPNKMPNIEGDSRAVTKCSTDDPLNGGIAFIKAEKVGGSTFSGVMRRIGFRRGFKHVKEAYWLSNVETPSVWANHGTREELEHSLQEHMPCALYVTLLRDPVERCMSSYYFQFYADGSPSPDLKDYDKISFMQGYCPSNEEAAYVGKDGTTNYAEVMGSYDFVGVTERFDESLLLLGKKINVSMADLLYLEAKEAGEVGTDQKDFQKQRGEHPPFDQEPADVKEAAEAIRNGKDAKLLKAANRALDAAIDDYGADFEDDLARYQHMLAKVEKNCRDHFFDSCLWNDNGCGQDCIDELVKEKGWM